MAFMVDGPGSASENPQLPKVPEASDASLPATPEMKKDLLDLIDQKLKDTKHLNLVGQGSKSRDFIDEETNRPVDLVLWETPRDDGSVANVRVTKWVEGQSGGPRNTTNYNFRETPAGLTVKKTSHDEEDSFSKRFMNASMHRDRQATHELISEANVRAGRKAEADEKKPEIIFNQKDAKDLKDLIAKVVPNQEKTKSDPPNPPEQPK